MLFNRFTETVFLKQESELEKKIAFLKEYVSKYPSNQKASKDLKLAEIGLKGEHEIEFELKHANIGMYVLHDITIQYEDLRAQIDYVVITPAGTYLIECKNLLGNITVDKYGNFTREYEYKGKKVREGIYSPYTQAERHKEVLRKIWKSKHSAITQVLFGGNFDKLWYKSLVVMANSKNVLNVRYAPKEIKERIIKSDALVRRLKDDIEKTKKEDRLTPKDMESYAQNFLKLHVDQTIDYSKVYQDTKTEENDHEDLKDVLIQFRKTKSKSRNIPAYYIFTNDELDKILATLPRTLEELEKSKTLSSTKVKLHGEEIVSIINKKMK